MPGNTEKRRKFWGLPKAKLVPTTQAVEHAMWLFVQAIEECVCAGPAFCQPPCHA